MLYISNSIGGEPGLAQTIVLYKPRQDDLISCKKIDKFQVIIYNHN